MKQAKIKAFYPALSVSSKTGTCFLIYSILSASLQELRWVEMFDADFDPMPPRKGQPAESAIS